MPIDQMPHLAVVFDELQAERGEMRATVTLPIAAWYVIHAFLLEGYTRGRCTSERMLEDVGAVIGQVRALIVQSGFMTADAMLGLERAYVDAVDSDATGENALGPDDATCLGCGCTTTRACVGGCFWLITDTQGNGVCSNCDPKEVARRKLKAGR